MEDGVRFVHRSLRGISRETSWFVEGGAEARINNNYGSHAVEKPENIVDPENWTTS